MGLEFKGDFPAAIMVALQLTANRVHRVSAAAMRGEAEKIADLAGRLAPQSLDVSVQANKLESALIAEHAGGERAANGRFEKNVSAVLIDPRALGTGGKGHMSAADYGYLMHEGMLPDGANIYKPSMGTQTKPDAEGMTPGGKFLERALKHRSKFVRGGIQRAVSEVIRNA